VLWREREIVGKKSEGEFMIEEEDVEEIQLRF